MGKLAVLLTAGTGTTVVSVGGFYLVQNSGTGNSVDSITDTGSGSSSIRKQENKTLMFDSVSVFNSGSKNADCVSRYFTHNTTTLDISQGESSATEIEKSKSIPADSTFFKADAAGTSDPYESCLMVNWKKETYEDSKWKGTFTWLWTFIKGDEGFINFNLAKTSDDGQFTLEGVFYLVSKKDDSPWELKYKKPSNANVKADKDKLDDYFPKLGTIKDYTGESKSYWEFLDQNKSQMDSICKTGECADSSKQSEVKEEKIIWKKVDGTGSGKKLKDWSKDYKWWEKLYSKTDFDIEQRVESFSGEWELDTTPKSA